MKAVRLRADRPSNWLNAHAAGEGQNVSSAKNSSAKKNKHT